MSTLIIGDRIIRTSDPILQRKQAAQGMQQAGIGSLSGRTTDDDRGRQAREIQRDAGVETITRDSDRDYDENTERLIKQAKAERGIIDEPKKTGIFGFDFSNLGLPTINPVLGAIQGFQNTNQVLKKLSLGSELNSKDKLTLVNLVDRFGGSQVAGVPVQRLIDEYAKNNELSTSEARNLAVQFGEAYADIQNLVGDQQDDLQSYFDRMDKMDLGDTAKTMFGDVTGTRDTTGIKTLENITDNLGSEGLQFLKVTNPQAYYRLRPSDPDLANESFVSTGDKVADRRFNAKIMEARAEAMDRQSRADANMGIMAASPALPGLPFEPPSKPIDMKKPISPIVPPVPMGTGITPFDVRQFYASLPQYTQQGIMNPNLAQFYQNLGMFPGMTT